MRKTSTTWFIALVFLVPVVAFAGYKWYVSKFQSLPVYGKAVSVNGQQVDHRIPAFDLVNQDGGSSTLKEWEGRIVIADFFFTRCPSICPKMTKSLQTVQNSFGADEILIRSFSVDPERDDAAQLKWYSEKFKINNGNWHLLSGDKKEIYRLARNGFQIVATDGDGGAEDFIHSEKLVLVDKKQRIRGYYDGTNDKEVNELINDIKKLQNEK